MVTRLKYLVYLHGDECCRKGQTASQWLCQCDDIWIQINEAGGKWIASPCKAGLHLVGNQDNILLCTHFVKGFGKLLGHTLETALALDNFHDDSGIGAIHSLLKSLHIIVWKELDTWHKGLAVILVVGIVGAGESSHCAPVECILKGDDLVVTFSLFPLGIEPCKLDCRLVGLGAAVSKVDSSKVAECCKLVCHQKCCL